MKIRIGIIIILTLILISTFKIYLNIKPSSEKLGLNEDLMSYVLGEKTEIDLGTNDTKSIIENEDPIIETPKTLTIPLNSSQLPEENSKQTTSVGVNQDVPCDNPTLQGKILSSTPYDEVKGYDAKNITGSYESNCIKPNQVSYQWMVGGSVFQTNPKPSFVGLATGTYRILYTVMALGLKSEFNINIYVVNELPNTAPVPDILIPSYYGVHYPAKVRDDGSYYITFYTDSVVNDYIDQSVDYYNIQWFYERPNGQQYFLGYGTSLYYVDFTLPDCREDTFKLILKATDLGGLTGYSVLDRKISGTCEL